MAGAGEKFQRASIWISNTLGYWLKSGPEPVFPRGECGQQASCRRRGWADSPCRWKPGCHTGGNICSGSWLHEVPLLSHDSCCSYIQPWGRYQSWHEAAKRSQGRLRTSVKPDAGAKLDPPVTNWAPILSRETAVCFGNLRASLILAINSATQVVYLLLLHEEKGPKGYLFLENHQVFNQ